MSRIQFRVPTVSFDHGLAIEAAGRDAEEDFVFISMWVHGANGGVL